jgi:hypothetical protein
MILPQRGYLQRFPTPTLAAFVGLAHRFVGRAAPVTTHPRAMTRTPLVPWFAAALGAVACESAPVQAPLNTNGHRTSDGGTNGTTNGGLAAISDAGPAPVDAGAADATANGPTLDGGVRPDASRRNGLTLADVPISIVRLRTGSDPAVLTVALPFADGELAAPTNVQIFDGATELARNAKVLAKWPSGDVRSLLVGFATPPGVGSGKTLTARIRGATPKVLAGEPIATRTPTLRAFASGDRWASTGALGFIFQRADTGTLAPAFFRRAAPVFQAESNPPTGTNGDPHVRNYYDHSHALYMHLLATGMSAPMVQRIDEEVVQYRENEILHAGSRRGQYSAGIDTQASTPIDFNIVRRMYPQGLVEDYLVTGDARSLAVAREIADAFVGDVPSQTPYYPYTERIPAWTVLGLLPVYEATGDIRYLNAAKAVGAVALAHQRAMASKYPNQAFVPGLTGAFVQDRRGAWYDDAESIGSGAGSPFMTTLLVEALVRLHANTGDLAYLASASHAARWVNEGCAVSANDPTTIFTSDPDPASTDDPSLHTATFRYVCRAVDNRTALPGLNPMFAYLLGIGWQTTGDESFRSMARAVLAFDGWGYTIKEYNQGMRSATLGFLLLERPAGTVLPRI